MSQNGKCHYGEARSKGAGQGLGEPEKPHFHARILGSQFWGLGGEMESMGAG